MRNGLISVDAYKKSRAFYIYERKLRYCIEVFFRVLKRASGNASMEKVLCVSVLVKFPRAETRAFLPQWKAGLIYLPRMPIHCIGSPCFILLEFIVCQISGECLVIIILQCMQCDVKLVHKANTNLYICRICIRLIGLFTGSVIIISNAVINVVVTNCVCY